MKPLPAPSPGPLALITDLAGLKGALSSVLGVIYLFVFLAAIVLFVSGVMKNKEHPGEGKNLIIVAAMLAGGVAVVTILFSIFGLSDASLAPSYQ